MSDRKPSLVRPSESLRQTYEQFAAEFAEAGEDMPGIGARFVLSKKHRVALSADVAAGKDGTEFYFGVGESF